MVGGEGAARPSLGRRAPILARAAAGLALLITWLQAEAPPAWDAWWSAVRTPAAAALSYDERAGLPEGQLNILFVAARAACPEDQRVLLLADDPIAWIQGSYLLYPLRLDVVQTVDGFTRADLDVHAGGCVLHYGPQGARLEPFLARLDPLGCSPAGCLYRIGSAG